ncbi:MAG: histidine--tRNA ligase [Treponema sp.]|nr:histidine--tRNA ligase [Treponema sp.]
MAAYIEPKILKGFRDFLPPAEIGRRMLLEKIEASFRSYGFVPIDTPALEYTEILLGKGGGETDKQMYRFNDKGGRDVALRFDLTVPFARFLAEHRGELSFPFKRYHIAKVWRGENTQRGRYREFTQCDFDTIGSDSAACDFEILHMMRNTLLAIAGGPVIIRLNHRGVFNRFLSQLEILDKSVEVLRTVDKLGKIGKEETIKLLSGIAGKAKAEALYGFISIEGNFEETLRAMEAIIGPCPETERLGLILSYIKDAGITGSYILDPSITRGLDYYTGVVFESFLADLPGIGSVCSGGRYDNLVALYSSERSAPLSGIGASLGIDRLIAALEELGRIKPVSSYAACAIAWVSEGSAGACQVLAEKLRKEGLPCEVFLEEDKLTRQFQAAEKKGIKWLIIADPENPLSSPLVLRDLTKRENHEGLNIEEIIAMLTLF